VDVVTDEDDVKLPALTTSNPPALTVVLLVVPSTETVLPLNAVRPELVTPLETVVFDMRQP
jgi:hypothetical protein